MKSFNVDSKLTDINVIKQAIVTVCKSKRQKPTGSNPSISLLSTYWPT